MSDVTDHSGEGNVGIQTASVVDAERQPAFARRGVVWIGSFSLVFVALLTCLVIWHIRSPQLSFLFLKYGLRSKIESISGLAANQAEIRTIAAQQIVPVVLREFTGKPDSQLSQAERMQQQLMLETFNRILPQILTTTHVVKDMETGLDSKLSDPLFRNFLPLALRISPEIWIQWVDSITQGHFHMSQCRHVQQRAACELVIKGPSNQFAKMALLWERDGRLWRLRGIDGVDRLLKAMRSPS